MVSIIHTRIDLNAVIKVAYFGLA